LPPVTCHRRTASSRAQWGPAASREWRGCLAMEVGRAGRRGDLMRSVGRPGFSFRAGRPPTKRLRGGAPRVFDVFLPSGRRGAAGQGRGGTSPAIAAAPTCTWHL
jgi:hypothetical protein